MIYLDNAATTKPSQKFINSIQEHLENTFYNPSAPYKQGVDVSKMLDNAKKEICDFLELDYKNNLIFTGSATEANNIAILGSMRKNFKHLVFSEGEHPSVYNVAKELENQGLKVDFIPLQKNGQVDYDKLKQVLTKETSFISCMLVNNETGAINNLQKIVDIKNEICPNAIIHSDIVQGFGKVINCKYLQDIDIITFSAHKIYGCKGLGILYAKDIKKIKPIQFGGGQEYNLRSGTENLPAILAFVENVKEINLIKDIDHVKTLKETFIKHIKNDGVQINSYDSCSPYILNITFKGVRGETMLNACCSKDIIIGTGSACSSKKMGNRVLTSMGISNDDILHSVRISFSKYNTINEVEIAAKEILQIYLDLKQKMGIK